MRTGIHGRVRQVSLDVARTVRSADGIAYSEVLSAEAAAARKGQPKPNVFPFGWMFRGLADDAANRLPEHDRTAAQLVELAAQMNEADGAGDRDSDIPAAYTYLGQFIDHDITKTETLHPGLASNMEAAFHAARAGQPVSPLSPQDMALLVNKRVPALNLDSVLSSAAPRDERGAMMVGPVTVDGVPARPALPFDEPQALRDLHDLPRNPPSSTNEDLDRRARIGDPRNDENLVVAQLHVAFLRAHRRLVHECGLGAAKADLELQRLFQSIVIDDFLPTVCDPAIVARIVAKPGVFYRPTPRHAFMPLEFSVAAYRFGHSMVRNRYDYNAAFSGTDGTPAATLELLFMFTAFSGQNRGFATLPQNWIIDWSRWLPHGGRVLNAARVVDTMLAGGLMALPQHQGAIQGSDVNVLALRNLVRGYLLRLPTGQAVARAVGSALGDAVRPVTDEQIRAVARAASAGQLAALTAGGFDARTPLWYYMLAEAAHVRQTQGVSHLGPVASAIISDVLVQLVRLANDNVLTRPDWTPAIPVEQPGKVRLVDLLRFAQVFPEGTGAAVGAPQGAAAATAA